MSKDCSNCEKDFCDCLKESMRRAKKAGKTRSANGIKKALGKANIPFEATDTNNVVLVKLTNKADVYLSLLKDKSSGFWKFRISGKANWQTCPASKFIAACQS